MEYFRTVASSSEVMFAIAGPRFWKAESAGAKMVTLGWLVKVAFKSAAYRAPSKEV